MQCKSERKKRLPFHFFTFFFFFFSIYFQNGKQTFNEWFLISSKTLFQSILNFLKNHFLSFFDSVVFHATEKKKKWMNERIKSLSIWINLYKFLHFLHIDFNWKQFQFHLKTKNCFFKKVSGRNTKKKFFRWFHLFNVILLLLLNFYIIYFFGNFFIFSINYLIFFFYYWDFFFFMWQFFFFIDWSGNWLNYAYVCLISWFLKFHRFSSISKKRLLGKKISFCFSERFFSAPVRI